MPAAALPVSSKSQRRKSIVNSWGEWRTAAAFAQTPPIWSGWVWIFMRTACRTHGSGVRTQQQAPLVDHRPAVLVPVVVFARHRPVVVDERVDVASSGSACDRHQLDVGLDHAVGAEVVARDVERGPRVAPQVVRLGAAVGDRDADRAVVVDGVGDVRQLRAARPASAW